MIKIPKKGITLIELMVALFLFSTIIVSVLSSVFSMSIVRTKSMSHIHLVEQLYFFSEQLFSEIKEGGTLDFEEYWNRSTLGEETQSGHYTHPSGFGNYGNGGIIPTNTYGETLYFCLTKGEPFKRERIIQEGCRSSDLNSHQKNQSGSYQRYGQYAQQFWDASTPGNEDIAGKNLEGNENNKNLLNGPEAVMVNPKELYLIDMKKNTRTYFRWNIQNDPRFPDASCDINAQGEIPDTCLGNIQILKLDGLDKGWKHEGNLDNQAHNGVIDTWVCQTGWNCLGELIDTRSIATGLHGEWINLFPGSINVRNLRFEVLPKKDPTLAVDDPDSDQKEFSTYIHPYIRLSLEIGFSQGARTFIKGDNPKISLSTLINLDDF